MINFISDPVPHEEAQKMIADKPAISREMFDRLPTELKARAFTISGVEDMDVVQSVRDQIASLPAGADWDEVKESIAEKLSPYLTEKQAEARAELLMKHHAFAAYSASHARMADQMVDVFPFRQYLTTGGKNVRANHAALNGIILPSTHPFWKNHTPPWGFGCRCNLVDLTAEDRDEEHKLDQKRPMENRRVLEGAALKQLDEGRITRGLSTNVDIRTPKEQGGSYQWSASDTAIPYDEIKGRWDETTRNDFEEWASQTEITDGENLLDRIKKS